VVGEETGGAQHDHQEQDQGRMAHRPAREIEALHVTLQHPNSFAASLPATNAKRLRKGAKRRSNPYFLVARWIASLHSQMTAETQNDSAETTRTFWAGSIFCTPSATTLAPSLTPPAITTALLS